MRWFLKFEEISSRMPAPDTSSRHEEFVANDSSWRDDCVRSASAAHDLLKLRNQRIRISSAKRRRIYFRDQQLGRCQIPAAP